MKTVLIALALSLQAHGVSAQSISRVAIKCAGETESIAKKATTPESRTYIIDDRKKLVFTWDAGSEAEVPFCVNDCSSKFGASHIRIVEKDHSGSIILDIDRNSGRVMDLYRGGGDMQTFEGTCTKTKLPRPTGKAKF